MAQERTTTGTTVPPQNGLAGFSPMPDMAALQESKMIGVPDDYRAERTERRTFDPSESRMAGRSKWAKPFDYSAKTFVAPLYMKGAEFQPANWPPETIAKWQRKMAAIGLIDPKQTFRLGVWDDVTRAAYVDVLTYANSRAIQAERALDEMSAYPEVTQTPREPLSFQVTNPEDIKGMFDNVAVKALGRRLRDDELNRYVGAWQAEERRQQQQDYDSQATGGPVTAAPQTTAAVERKVRADNPVEAGVMDTIGYGNAFFDLLGGD